MRSIDRRIGATGRSTRGRSRTPGSAAVLEAGAVRARPILLTAATVILGDGVLLFDPLLEGLGLTLMSGALIATLLTLLLVPVLYHHLMSASARWAAWLQAVRADQRE